MQAQLWVLSLMAPHKLSNLKAEDEIHYKLHSKYDDRVTYGVDHESYAYQLALDMNSAPGIAHRSVGLGRCYGSLSVGGALAYYYTKAGIVW
ncbi:Uncharacterized protein HZ326_30434 [Fusarium oxysporum f. sp. albedinis]|nr:Uncharacterized protein HZ326_30434 [Fusarium oxysporum f. sp. albedinis]